MTRKQALEYALKHASGRAYPNCPESIAAFRAFLPPALRAKADRARARDFRRRYSPQQTNLE